METAGGEMNGTETWLSEVEELRQIEEEASKCYPHDPNSTKVCPYCEDRLRVFYHPATREDHIKATLIRLDLPDGCLRFTKLLKRKLKRLQNREKRK